jgi:hypothetical protein
MINHECDLLIVTPGGTCSEVEIKISREDLLADKLKRHNHPSSGLIHKLWFALPHYMEDCIEHIPSEAGVLLVNGYHRNNVRVVREPQLRKVAKWSVEQKLKLYRLASMRTWSLKQSVKYNREEVKPILSASDDIVDAVTTKEQLLKEFDEWLGSEFDKSNKDHPDETHRWLFCWNGEDPMNSGFDCACCLDNTSRPECQCACHDRVKSIVNYFWSRFKTNKEE